MAEKLADRMLLDPKTKQGILDNFNNNDKRISREALQIATDAYHLISEWYHFAIQSYLEIRSNKSETSQIANYFSLKPHLVSQALERLARQGLIIHKNGKYYVTGDQVNSPDGEVNISLKRAHHRNLDLAKDSLMEDDIDSRDFTSMTMAVDPAKLPQAKKMIREFRDELCEFLESGKKQSVYKVCFQLFPLEGKGK